MNRNTLLGALSFATLTTLALLPGQAGAGSEDRGGGHHGPGPVVTTIARFDPMAAPEAIAVTPDGSIYVSTSSLGEVWEVRPDGTTRVEAVLDAHVATGSFGVLGLDNDRDGRLYATVASGNADTAGVWTWLPGDTPVRLAGSDELAFPNASFVDGDGTIYVTDSLKGEIWRAPDGDRPLTLWLADPLLAGTGTILGPGFPIGANGIVEQDGVVYVANSEQASIVAVPVNADGTAGAARLWTTDPRLLAIDGIALGPDGVIYAAVNGSSSVYRVSWDTTLTLLADASDGLDYAADLSFGSGRYERSALVVNFSIGELFGQVGGAGPGVVRIDHAAPRPRPSDECDDMDR